MTERYDAVVIGAGHNGLVCAGYLARAGMRVAVCESAAAAGGIAAERRFGNGYRVPSLAHCHHAPDGTLVKDLELDRFGYARGEAVQTIALGGQSGRLVITSDAASGDGLGAADIAAYPEFRSRYTGFAHALAPLFESKPPRLKNFSGGDRSTLARLGWKVRFGLGRDAMYEFLRVAAINMHDVLDECFEDERLKGAIAFDAVLGSAMGPRTPGSVLTWLNRLHAERSGAPSLANGSLIAALVASAEAAGVTLRYQSPVERILLDGDTAAGVLIAGGERLHGARVVAALDPRAAFLQLIGAPGLDTQFANRVTQIRGAGVVGKLHLGLSALPEFAGVAKTLLGQRLLIAPSLRYLERAFNASKYGEHSAHPALEITIPSLNDPSLAPAGHHVMSVNVTWLPYRLKGGWEGRKEDVARHVLAEIAAHAPGIEPLVTDHELLSPADIERDYGAVMGHWHHGELSIHQSFMMRPLYGAAQYNTPIEALYLCSAGCHPGGGVTGLPGRNAAKRILADGDTG